VASPERWLDVFDRAYREPGQISALACPNCGARELRLRFVLYGSRGIGAYAVFWCGSCLQGLPPGPSKVPAAWTPVRREDAGVPDYQVVPPIGRNQYDRRAIAVVGGKPTVEARLVLLSAERGGLRSPMPTGSRSLLLAFASPEPDAEDVRIGAVIDVIGGPALVPGSAEVPVIVRFWADEAEGYATPGVSFTLWYGRAVGTGVVTQIVDKEASA
jgi:hypothetical protein